MIGGLQGLELTLSSVGLLVYAKAKDFIPSTPVFVKKPSAIHPDHSVFSRVAVAL